MSAEVIPAILILAVVAVCAFSLKAVANSCYRKTGVNILSSLHKLLWYVEIGAALLLAEMRHADTAAKAVPILIMCIVIFTVIQMLLSMKAGIKYAVISGVLQGVCGIILGVFNIFVFLFGLFFHTSGGLFSIDESLKPIKTMDLEKADYAAMQKGFADAVAWAKSSGFADASSAYDSGFFKDKL